MAEGDASSTTPAEAWTGEKGDEVMEYFVAEADAVEKEASEWYDTDETMHDRWMQVVEKLGGEIVDVLDVGMGRGGMLDYIDQKIGVKGGLYGVDISKASIDYCTKHHPKFHVALIEPGPLSLPDSFPTPFSLSLHSATLIHIPLEEQGNFLRALAGVSNAILSIEPSENDDGKPSVRPMHGFPFQNRPMPAFFKETLGPLGFVPAIEKRIKYRGPPGVGAFEYFALWIKK